MKQVIPAAGSESSLGLLIGLTLFKVHMTAQSMIEALLPTLKSCATYSLEIQKRIQAAPKQKEGNPFAQALSDADASIQTAVEIELLARYPGLHFFGEEETANTKYLAGTYFPEVALCSEDIDPEREIDFEELLASGELLALLDPIDGTRYYLDNLDYQVIFSLTTREGMLASIVLMPRHNAIFYAEAGKGLYRGTFSDSLADFSRVQLSLGNGVVVASIFVRLAEVQAPEVTKVYHLDLDYDGRLAVPNMFSLLLGEVSATVVSEANLHDNYALAFMVSEGGGCAYQLDGVGSLPVPESLRKTKGGTGLIIASDVRFVELLTDNIEVVKPEGA